MKVSGFCVSLRLTINFIYGVVYMGGHIIQKWYDFTIADQGGGFTDRRIWLKKLLGFRILRIHFTDWRNLKAQWITDFFKISV